MAWKIIGQALYFMLPAYLANMAPVLVKWVRWHTPMDFRKSFRGTRIFGDHKTWRGLVAGIFAGIATLLLQRYFSAAFRGVKTWELVPYADFSMWFSVALGAIFGGGALIGDAVKSFFKRRMGIAAGASWIPFDQLDAAIGALLAVSWFFVPSTLHLLAIIFITPLLMMAVNYLGFWLGLRTCKL